MATWALLIQFIMCPIDPCCTGSTDHKCDEHDNLVFESGNKIALYRGLTMKWITYIFLNSGVIDVMLDSTQCHPGPYIVCPSGLGRRDWCGGMAVFGVHHGDAILVSWGHRGCPDKPVLVKLCSRTDPEVSRIGSGA